MIEFNKIIQIHLPMCFWVAFFPQKFLGLQDQVPSLSYVCHLGQRKVILIGASLGGYVSSQEGNLLSTDIELILLIFAEAKSMHL